MPENRSALKAAVSYNGRKQGYCNDNPVNYNDSEGTEPELAMGWAASMSWLPAIDGPVPVGDAIYILGFVAICCIRT